MSSEQVTAGTVFGRDFRVLERLAAGGMGTVYVAQQLSTLAEGVGVQFGSDERLEMLIGEAVQSRCCEFQSLQRQVSDLVSEFEHHKAACASVDLASYEKFVWRCLARRSMTWR